MADAKKDKLQIRNSTVDFLVFTKDAHEDGIEVRVQDHDVWLTQKAIARLFDVDRSVVTKHLKNVYESGELSEDATCANFAQVADNGKTYHYKFYLSLIHIFPKAAVHRTGEHPVQPGQQPPGVEPLDQPEARPQRRQGQGPAHRRGHRFSSQV